MPPDPLSENPFFETPARHERLQLLLHLIRNAGPAIYLRGPDGAGKTRFGEHLIEHIDDEAQTAVLDAATQVDLVSALGALSASPGASLPEVLRELAERPLLLVIDNADELVAVTAQVLASWQEAGGRVLLLGRGKPEALRELLDIQYVDLPPFEEAESATFLRQRAGGAVARVTDDLVTAVHGAAAGQPGALLHALEGIIAEGAAVAGKADRPPAKRGGSRIGLILTALLMLGVIVGGLIYQDDINALFEPTQEAPVTALTPAVEQAVSAPPAPPVAESDAAGPQEVPPVIHMPEPVSPMTADQAAGAAADTPGERMPAVAQTTAGTADGRGDAGAVMAEVAESGVKDPLDAVMADALAAAEAAAGGQPASTPAPDGIADAGPVVQAVAVEGSAPVRPPVAGEPAPQTPPQPAAAPESAVAAEPGAAPVEEREPAPTAVGKAGPRPEKLDLSLPPEVEPAPAVVEVASPGPDDGDWLQTRKPSNYTLQLVGARDRASIEKFIRDHRLARPYAVFSRSLDGRPWYSLVAGDYPDRDAAVAARARLPAALQTAGVWPRTFASIQETK